MGAVFQRELSCGFTAAQLTAAQLTAAGILPLSPSFREHLERLPANAQGDLPPPAVCLFISAWGHLRGLVVLEVFGHTSFLGGHQAEIFDAPVRTMFEDMHGPIPGPAAG
ncbi:hypothetical protein [Streptomyces pactum]|uniref:Uncharacterized protein n=1 Tax=Streptomyces pactum TaxID=68249 RepID=A0A1S6JI19_9ACTN|nr:hypothetical protein [Streptomyces pactum]AQS71403.1 hypothetical protein B1H29_35115 [Streptomyces pactum]